MIVALEQDENGDLILPLSDELCAEAGWKIGDTIEWIDNGDGSWIMRKKEMEKELVLVECVSTFRMRYVVEANNASDAKDEVTMNDDGKLREFSQMHVDEMITSTREIDRAEYLRLFDEDNDYLQDWDEEQKLQFLNVIDYDK